jgi:hypothetical protein
MKVSVKNIAISALLILAMGLFLTAFARNARAQSVVNVTGTTWVGTDSDGDYYEYTFVAGGVLHLKSPTGVSTNNTWQQVDDTIYMDTYFGDTTKKYSERMGQITGTHMEGKAINIAGRTWSWVADLRTTTP